MQLYNSFTRQKEEFIPLNPPAVGLYTCGPTVYDYAHIGHGRKYVGDDVLRRALVLLGYQVTHVQNITDVGHLVSDSDEGEDKLEKGAQKTGRSVWEVAEFFTNHFFEFMNKLNVLPPTVICRATDHISEQIKLIQQLVDRRYAYETDEAVYYDVTKFVGYDDLFGQSLSDKHMAVREGVHAGSTKKHPADFVLWFKKVGRFENHVMSWSSPWGEGFPGWHIECSAMSMKYLGQTIDIHTGGEDHLSIHHPNEIAQSEGATGQKFARYWVHYAFLMVDGRKMSKSLNNYYRIEDIEAAGYSAADLRYFYLTTHYRKSINFTWEGIEAAHNSRAKICSLVNELKVEAGRSNEESNLGGIDLNNGAQLEAGFVNAIGDDLNTSQALAILWQTIRGDLPPNRKIELVEKFNQVLGLKLTDETTQGDGINAPVLVEALAQKRQSARQRNDYIEADRLRELIEAQGFVVLDLEDGYQIKLA